MSLLDTVMTSCPYCGEAIELLIDGSIQEQQYVEDCPVCCRPMVVKVELSPSMEPEVQLRREDDA